MKKIEFVLQLPWKIEGDRFYFFAEDESQAEEIVLKMLCRLQDICEHAQFKCGKCTDCDFECEHQEIEDRNCLDCGEFIEPFGPDEMDLSKEHKESA